MAFPPTIFLTGHDFVAFRNPGFSGEVSLIGHSLGSLILFDLLAGLLKKPIFSSVADPDPHGSVPIKFGRHAPDPGRREVQGTQDRK
jgi:hypothetical protein